MKQRNNGSFFIPDVNKKLNVTKIKLLELCKLDRFLQEGSEWSNKSPELIKLQEFVFKDLARFNQVLGCGIAITDSPITVIQKILKQINQRLPYLRNIRDGDNPYLSPKMRSLNPEALLHICLTLVLTPCSETTVCGLSSSQHQNQLEVE